MRPVGVHLENGGRTAVECHPEARQVRPAKPRLGGPVEDPDPGIGRGEPVGDLPGAVG